MHRTRFCLVRLLLSLRWMLVEESNQPWGRCSQVRPEGCWTCELSAEVFSSLRLLTAHSRQRWWERCHIEMNKTQYTIGANLAILVRANTKSSFLEPIWTQGRKGLSPKLSWNRHFLSMFWFKVRSRKGWIKLIKFFVCRAKSAF